MAWYRSILPSSRRATPVGHTLESGSAAEEESRGRSYYPWVLGLILILVSVIAFPSQQYSIPLEEVNSTWQREDLKAPFNFSIYKSEAKLAEDLEGVRLSTPVLFREQRGAADSLRARRDRIHTLMGRALAAYADWQLGDERDAEPARDDSLRHVQLRDSLPFTLAGRQWDYLTQSYAQTVPGLTSSARTTTTRSLDENLLDTVLREGLAIQDQRVLNVEKDSLFSEDINVVDEESRYQRQVPINEVLGWTEARNRARLSFHQAYPGKPDTVAIAMTLFSSIFEPTLVYLEEDSEELLQQRIDRVSEVQGMVRQGDSIVQQGEVVTTDIRAKMVSLNRVLEQRGGTFRRWSFVVGQTLLVLGAFGLIFVFLTLLRPEIWNSRRDMTLIFVLILMVVLMFAGAVRTPYPPSLSFLIVPVALTPLLLTVLYDSRIALMVTVALALLGGGMIGFDYEYVVFTTFAGFVAALSVRDVRNRSRFMASAGIILLTYVLTLATFNFFRVFELQRFLIELGLVLFNALFLLLSLPVLWMLERSFGVTTDITLLELSDTNQPLLRELSVRASGTFNHTLQVANLAEAAADAVGANALLTRVGALYHDIGKMLKPEYFVENQQVGENPHDRLTPKMSALIIISHVKDGLEMARERGLPEPILDFVPMHHGTTRIEYFYQKALKNRTDRDPEILETDFRYPGPRPKTKETGILMLADAVEAASKAMASSGKASPKKFESLIDSIFRNRLEDGQLDHCPLTFADLGKIKETFLSMLAGMYHFRIAYPGQEKEPPPKPLKNQTRTLSTRDGKRIVRAADTGAVTLPPAAEETEGEAGKGEKEVLTNLEVDAPIEGRALDGDRLRNDPPPEQTPESDGESAPTDSTPEKRPHHYDDG